MGPINNIPKGLLSYLGLQQQGNYPWNFADAVAPTLEIERYITEFVSTYVNWNVSFGPGGINSGAQAFNTFSIATLTSTVPQDEFWLIPKFSMIVGVTAAASLVPPALLAIIRQGGAALRTMVVPQTRLFGPTGTGLAGSAGGTSYALCCSTVPFFARGGDQIVPYCTDINGTVGAGGTANYICDIDIIRLKS